MLKTELPPLTNQELIQELQKRVKEGTLKMEITADEVKATSGSLLSFLGGKELLFLVGLTATAALLFAYFIKVTSNRVASCRVEFDQHPPLTLNQPITESN